jgi:hypothetical protein
MPLLLPLDVSGFGLRLLQQGEAMKITREAIDGSSVDILAQIQQRNVDAYIARERAELAAVTDDYTAWMFYPPTPHDDPAEYAPYWSRLTDVVADDDEREAIVASWLAEKLT